MKIFVGKTEIAGIAHGLYTGLRALNCDVSLVVSLPHPFKYEYAGDGLVPRVWLALGSLIMRNRHNFPLKVLTWLLWQAWSWVVLLWALPRFDSYIFIFGRSITNSWIEDVLHRALGHKLIFIYCGSDIRPPYIDGPACQVPGGPKISKLGSAARRMARQLHRRERFGFRSVNSPLTGQFHSQAYVNWFSIGVPREIPPSDLVTVVDGGAGAPVRILHSPSHPEIKGSAIIRAMVERLREKGKNIEFVELRGVPNAVVIDELRKCDFIVDQLYSDTPMAGFATEAAMVGKPAIIGSYAAAQFQQHAREWALPPSLCVHPDHLEAAIEKMIDDVAYRQSLGREAHDFVHASWSLDAVSTRYLRLLSGDIPDEWLVEPGFEYVEGCGLAEAQVRDIVRQVVESGGPGALQMQHSPELERAFLRFAAS
ncbi:hypothetical protein ACFOMD_07620 [Sphingoaurantiacus capsulatus]|uniref:Glycosyltransferase n=1 Tax=Sphingoaurantiacus capsulatus TaxID=1771310 RepID=A0ABV7XB16_9SPHN